MKDIHDEIAELKQRVAALESTVGKPPEEQPHRQAWPDHRWPEDRQTLPDAPASSSDEKVDEEEAERVGS